jgi:acetyltransferase-like isoleucine patch superfamily enzyme
VAIGEGCLIYGTNPWTFGSEPYLVRIGNEVTIAHDVTFITHDGALAIVRDEHPDADFIAPIWVEDGAMIGARSIILPGVTVGAKSAIAAGSVVTRSVPPKCVAGGIPCRVLKSAEDYWSGKKDHVLPTFRMTRSEKRAFLEDHFSSWIAASSGSVPSTNPSQLKDSAL